MGRKKLLPKPPRDNTCEDCKKNNGVMRSLWAVILCKECDRTRRDSFIKATSDHHCACCGLNIDGWRHYERSTIKGMFYLCHFCHAQLQEVPITPRDE